MFTRLKAQKETIIKKETITAVKLPACTIGKSNTGNIKEKAVVMTKELFNPDFAVDYFMRVYRKIEYKYATRIQR